MSRLMFEGNISFVNAKFCPTTKYDEGLKQK